MPDNEDHPSPGAVGPARTTKAGCGIRYDENELREGIDFSGAALLRAELEARVESGEATEIRQRSDTTTQTTLTQDLA